MIEFLMRSLLLFYVFLEYSPLNGPQPKYGTYSNHYITSLGERLSHFKTHLTAGNCTPSQLCMSSRTTRTKNSDRCPYNSSNLAHSHFRDLKCWLAFTRFEELKFSVQNWLKSQTDEFYTECLNKIVSQHQKCFWNDMMIV